ncbi:hypothetical protein ABS784_17110, partial [Geobacillus sp. G4]
DGTHCTLENTLDHWECSCPADNICKHVLISILYYQREHQTEDTLNQGEAALSEELAVESGLVTESRFRWMVESELAPLIKSYRSSLIEEVL